MSIAKNNVDYLNDIKSWDTFSTQSISNKLKEAVSVKDFGAVGDGVTNDTAAFQAAIDAGTSVYIPNGTYKLTSTIYVRVGLVFHGASMRDTILDFSTCTGPSFGVQLNRYGAGYRLQGFRDCEFAFFKMIGNEAASGNHGFYSNLGMHRTVFRRIWLYSCGGNGHHWDCDNEYGGFYNRISECVFGDPSDFSAAAAANAHIKGDAIFATGSCNQNIVDNNIFWRGNKNFINLLGTPTWSIQRWTITNNGLEGAGHFRSDTGFFGVRIDGDSLCMNISDNYIEGNGLTSPFLGGGIYVNSSACDVTIRNNLFASNPRDIWISGCLGGVIDGNQWVTQPTYHNIRVDSVGVGFLNIGTNNSLGPIVGKYLDIALAAQPRVYGDSACALTRGNTPLAGKFTPKLYGGATEISCSSAIATYRREKNVLFVKFNITVSNLNGATGLIGIAGSDGINLAMPGLGSTVQYPFKNDATEISTSRSLYMSLVNLGAGYTECQIIASQTGALYAFLRAQGSNVANVNLNATALTVGSILKGEFEVVVA